MPELRPYQHHAVSEIRSALASSKSVILAMQVGSGKTTIAAEIIRRVLERGNRALFVVHRIELVEQARDRLLEFDITAGIIKAGFEESRHLSIQVACVPTLIQREFPPAELVIFDECHHVVSDSWMRVLDHYREGGAWILGITATPLRLDGKPLGAAFDAIIEPVTTRELIDGGYLLEPTVYAPPSINRKGLKVRGGDYALPELAERMQKLTASITDYWEDYCQDRRTLAFAVNIEHSRQIEEALRERGARIMHIDGTTSPGLRSQANQMLRAGELDIVTQCQVWIEGLDIPELEALIVARPTKSFGLHRQMIGRVMRPAPGKTDAIILDHAGNHHEHGKISDEVEWSLEGKPKLEAAEPITTCPECFAVIPPGLDICPLCFADLSSKEEVEPPGVEHPGELVEYKEPSKAEKAEFYAGQVRTASMFGYSVGWARYRYMDKFHVWPRGLRDIEREEYTCRGHDYEPGGYRNAMRCRLCYNEEDAA